MSKVTCYGRLVYIEPNDIASGENPHDNVSWKPEDLNMSVDLQVVVPGRNDYAKNNSDENLILTTLNWDATSGIGRFVSFMQGADIRKNSETVGHELTTDYINATYSEIYKDGKSSKESLGIESIDITFDSHFYPVVNIKFIDVRGFSLMMPTEEEYLGSEEWRNLSDTERTRMIANGGYSNFFRSVFHFPYPRFLLTIKGFYGTAITFILAVNEFKNSFNSQTGNFEVNISFIGYMYGLYTDLPLNLLIAAPYYGITGSRDTSEATEVNEYWKDKFQFDDGFGGIGGNIYTFIEFIKKYNELEKDRNDIRNGTSGYESLNRIVEINNQLDKIDECIEALIATFSVGLNEAGGPTEIRIDYDRFLYTNNKDVVQYQVDVTLWNDFVDKWANLKSTNIDLNTPKWTPPELFDRTKGDYAKLTTDQGSYGQMKAYNQWFHKSIMSTVYTETTGNNGSIDFSDIKGATSNPRKDIAKFASDNKTNEYVFYLFPSFIIDTLNEAKEKLNEEKNGLSLRSNRDIENMYNANIGFDSSILNIYRMIFAHIDTFMYLFYNLFDTINRQGAEREFGHFGWDLSLTDLNTRTASTTKVPPFPAIYRKGDNDRREEIYPGSLGGVFAEMEEVKFVENMINGIFHLKYAAVREMQRGTESRDFNEERERGLTGSQFLPTAISDYYHFKNRSNPWCYVSNTEQDIFTELLLRIASYKCQMNNLTSNQLKAAPKSEAISFTMLHTESPSSRLKDWFGAMKDESTISSWLTENGNEVLKSINTTCFGSTENGFTYEDGKLTILANDTPVYFTKPNSNGGFVTLKDSDNERITALIESGERENVEEFKRTVYSLSNSYPEYSTISVDIAGSVENPNGGRVNIQVQESKLQRPSEASGGLNFPGILKGQYNRYYDWFFYDDQDKLNDKGNFFFSDTYKQYEQIDGKPHKQVTAFLLALVNAMYSSDWISGTGKGVKVETDSLGKTSIKKISYASLLLIGAILKNGERDDYAKSGEKGIITRYTANNELVEYIIEHYERIKANKVLFDKIIAIYDGFIDNGWREFYTQLIDTNNYEQTSDGDFLMKIYLKNAIFDTFVDENKGYYIYNITRGVNVFSSQNITINTDELAAFFSYLTDYYSTRDTLSEQYRVDFDVADVGDGFKLSLYNTLKNLYDKWMNSYSSESFRLRDPISDHQLKVRRYQGGEEPQSSGMREFDNFIFVDCFYNDISRKFKINPSTIVEIISNHIMSEDNYSTYEFMYDIAQRNRMLFQALPVYNNFYSPNTIEKIFSPNIDETMKIGFGSTYVCMYTYEVSHVTEDNRFDDHLAGDYIGDLNDITGNIKPVDRSMFNKSEDDDELNLTVPAFGVTYARQNQMYFKNIDVNMDNPRVTDYSIANLFALTNPIKNGGLNTPHTVANDIYSIYANRSYNCSVDMMGCANIMPMMYFQLNNIPMFRGAYMITNVEHHIKAGDFTTRFTGVRVAKNQLPYNMSIYNIEQYFANGDLSGSLVERHGGYEYSTTGSCDGFNIDAIVRPGGRMDREMDIRDNLTQAQEERLSPRERKLQKLRLLPNGPRNNKTYLERCARATRLMLQYGLKNASDRTGLDRYNEIMDGGGLGSAYMWHYNEEGIRKEPLIYIGFELICTIPKGTLKENCDNYYQYKAGDLCVINHFEGSRHGHFAIFDGKNWISDAWQTYMYCYGSEGEPTKADIWVYRWKKCEESTRTAPIPNTSGMNLTEAQRGKLIMDTLKRELSLTDFQVIGIGAFLHRESGWDPTARNDSRKNKDSGISQWTVVASDRQEAICRYLNNKYNTSYEPCITGTPKEVNPFILIPLDRQIEALIWEATERFPNIYKYAKKATTADEACDIWTVLSGCGKAGAPSVWLASDDNIRNKDGGNWIVEQKKLHREHISIAEYVFYHTPSLQV